MTEIPVGCVIATITPSAKSAVVDFTSERKRICMVRILPARALPGNSHYGRTRMKRFLAILLLMPSVAAAATNTVPTFDEKAPQRFRSEERRVGKEGRS